MKGSVGTASVGISGGIGARSAGIGARASGARTGSKSFGVSLSPEARAGGAVATAFSSRGLAAHRGSPISRESITKATTPKSMFNMNRAPVPSFTVPYEAKTRFSNSIFNINHGREVKSPFARTSSLKSNRGMFDRTRPITRDQMIKHDVKPMIQVRPSSILNINRGKETKFPLANSRPLGEVLPTPKISIEQVLWERSKATPSKSVDVVSRQKENTVKQSRKTEIRSVLKQKTERAPKRMKLSHMITIAPDVSPDTLVKIRQDIKDAKKMVPLVARARNVSVVAAQKELAQVLAKKYEGKVSVKPQVQTRTEVFPDTKPQVKVEPKVGVQTVTQTEKRVSTKTIAGENQIPPKEEVKKISFKKQIEVNTARVKAFVDAARNLLRYRNAADASLTGKDIAYAVGKFVEEQISEVALPINTDATLKEVSQEVSGLGAVENIEAFESAVEQITSGHSAIQLTTREGDAKDEDAQKVYGVALDGQVGYFGEEKETGKFEKKLVAGELYFVTQRQARQTS